MLRISTEVNDLSFENPNKKHNWEQKPMKMFYFTPNVANGRLVKLKGKKQLESQQIIQNKMGY